MIYAYAFAGFVIGFIVGLVLNRFLLADLSYEEIKENKEIRRKYGLLNWAVALLGALIGTLFV